MEKIVVEVTVPILETGYDIFIPPDVPLYQVLGSVCRAVTELSEGRFIAGPGTQLCTKNRGTILDINRTAWEQGIRNGSRLLLI